MTIVQMCTNMSVNHDAHSYNNSTKVYYNMPVNHDAHIQTKYKVMELSKMVVLVWI